MDQQSHLHKTTAVLHVLSEAVSTCGRSRREVARIADMNKDTLHRVLCGSRDITLSEVLRILAATENSPETTLLLTLLGYSDLALSWRGSETAQFLAEMFSRLPRALAEGLGDRLMDIRPKWGAGASALMVRMLGEHMDELARRDDDFGQGRVTQSNGVR